jgi:hypothetical protein
MFVTWLWPTAVAAIEPWFVEVHALNSTAHTSQRLGFTSVIADYKLQESLTADFIQELVGQPKTVLKPLDGHFGRAQFILPSGESLVVRMRSFPDDNAFRSFIAEEIERRGDLVSVQGSDSEFSITVEAPPVIPGTPHITWNDMHVTYHGGVMATSESRLIFAVPPGALGRVIREAEGKDSFYRFTPNAIPESFRVKFLQQFAIAGGRHAQGRDGEAREISDVRRAAYDSSIKLLKGILFDLEECIAWSETMLEQNSFHGKGIVRAVEGSVLAEWIKTLRSRPGNPLFTQSESEIGIVSLRAGLPSDWIPVVLQFANNGHTADSLPGALILQQVRSGYLDLHFALSSTSSSEPILNGGLRTQFGPEEFSEFAAPFSPSRIEGGRLKFQIESESLGLPVGPLQVIAALENDLLQVAMSPEKRIVDEFRFATTPNADRPGLSTIAELRWNPRPWLSHAPEAGTRQLLDRVEEAWEWNWLMRNVGPSFIEEFTLSRQRPGFPFLTEHMSADGNCSLDATLASDDETLIAEWNVGFELYRWSIARRLLFVEFVQRKRGEFMNGLRPAPR